MNMDHLAQRAFAQDGYTLTESRCISICLLSTRCFFYAGCSSSRKRRDSVVGAPWFSSERFAQLTNAANKSANRYGTRKRKDRRRFFPCSILYPSVCLCSSGLSASDSCVIEFGLHYFTAVSVELEKCQNQHTAVRTDVQLQCKRRYVGVV